MLNTPMKRSKLSCLIISCYNNSDWSYWRITETAEYRPNSWWI